MAAERDIHVKQDNTFVHAIVIWDGLNEQGQKVPSDLTGYKFFSDIKKAGSSRLSPAVGDVLGSFSVSIEDNIVTLTLSSEDSAQVPPGKHWYDIQSISPDGKVFTYLAGNITFLPGVA
jgi:hypothetical protein